MDNTNTIKKLDLYEIYKDEMCPICGYLCLGKGGIGCIDKPILCGMESKQHIKGGVSL